MYNRTNLKSFEKTYARGQNFKKRCEPQKLIK